MQFAPAPAVASDKTQELIGRMDQAALRFRTMSSKVTYLTHTEVLHEDSTETGTAVMKKVQAGEVQGLIDFLTPDKRTVVFEKRRLQIFYPKIKTVQEWDLGKHGEQLDQFLMIGFGTSGMELARGYSMKVLGTESLKGQSAIRVSLIPKTGEAKEYVAKIELWVPEHGDPYPLQEKVYEPSGDYRLVTYTDLKINAPLPPEALKLNLPAGVKTEYPQK